MGYDVHITRKQEWFEKLGPSISLEDWLQYVATDAEMRPDGYAEAHTTNGNSIRVDRPGIAVWTAYSKHGVGGNLAWFCHLKDKVTVKNPDKEMLVKMFAIASALSAHVQGDEGEEYGSNGEAVS